VEDQVGNLQRVVEGQQFQIENLSRRLERLEFGGGEAPVRPRENVTKNKIDAEFSAKESCSKDVHSMYCQGGTLKCDSTLDTAVEGEIYRRVR
jgi:hypothetical protein